MVLASLRSCKQHGGEPVRYFSRRLQALHRQAFPTERDSEEVGTLLLAYLIEGLRDEQLKRDASRQKFTSYRDALNWLSSFEEPDTDKSYGPRPRVRAVEVEADHRAAEPLVAPYRAAEPLYGSAPLAPPYRAAEPLYGAPLPTAQYPPPRAAELLPGPAPTSAPYRDSRLDLLVNALNTTNESMTQMTSRLGPQPVDTCEHCGRTGHSAANCYSQHRATRTADGSCYRCGKQGHRIADCRSGPRRPTNSRQMTCFKCGRHGHMQKECRSRPQQRRSRSRSRSRTHHRSSSRSHRRSSSRDRRHPHHDDRGHQRRPEQPAVSYIAVPVNGPTMLTQAPTSSSTGNA